MYKNKRVSLVAPIRGVVRLPRRGEATVQWVNDETSKPELVAEARRRSVAALGVEWGEEELRVFVLGDRVATSFAKDTKGGMMGSKQYFDLSALAIDTSTTRAVAEALRSLQWSDVP